MKRDGLDYEPMICTKYKYSMNFTDQETICFYLYNHLNLDGVLLSLYFLSILDIFCQGEKMYLKF